MNPAGEEDLNTVSTVLFFLGAGASVAAGVPDTFKLVDEFLIDLKAKKKKENLEFCKKILRLLVRSGLASDGKVDVELLLETFDQLENLANCIPLKFFKSARAKLHYVVESQAKRTELDNLASTI